MTRNGPSGSPASPASTDDRGPHPGRFDARYDRAVADLLEVPVEESWLDTPGGATHALLAGDPDAPPVLVLQGGNVTTPVTLAWVQALADEYRLVAPDTPGEPGRSAREPPTSYGTWVVDVLDALGLDAVPVVGVSHGGGVALETLALAPDRVTAAALLVPAGLGTTLSPVLARVVAPALAYRLVPSRRLLAWALAPLFTEPVADVEDVVVDTVGLALRTGDLAASFPGPDDPAALARVEAPTLVVVAAADPFFPADRVVPRATTWLPSLVEPVVLDDEAHFLSRRGRERATERVRALLEDV